MLKRIWVSFWLIFLATLTFASVFVALAAFSKSHDTIVMRNGFAHDYILLAIIAAVVGGFAGSVTVFIAMRLLRPKAPPPVSHF